jgi:HEAT repeat protein
VAPALGKLLADDELRGPAAQALLAIGDGAAEEFRAALPKAAGRARVTVIHALGTLRDTQSAEALRKLLADADRDTRLTAAWAVSTIGDGASADALFKLADAAEGYERAKLNQACLLLAERLAAAGKRADAERIYKKLHDSRTDSSELHVRDAAARALGAK